MAPGQDTQDSSQFCLKWDGFHGHLASVFETLRQDEQLVDVTLCCEGRRLKAHRVMLSAASPFFRDLIQVSRVTSVIRHNQPTSLKDQPVSSGTLKTCLPRYLKIGRYLLPSPSLCVRTRTYLGFALGVGGGVCGLQGTPPPSKSQQLVGLGHYFGKGPVTF